MDSRIRPRPATVPRMELTDRVCVITGGAGGIGAALAERFIEEGAEAVVVSDLDEERTISTAETLSCTGIPCDITDEKSVQSLVAQVLAFHGRIDLFVSNAGASVDGGIDIPDDDWQTLWNLHVMAHVYAARAVIEPMIAEGGGYLLQTVSAAGLLASLSSLPYTVTKTASLSLAEWLAIVYRESNIRVSALCPLVVQTPLAARFPLDIGSGPAMSPDEVARAVIDGIREERFLILPHPEVEGYLERKHGDRDRWIAGMSRLYRQVTTDNEKREGVGR